MSTNSIYSEEDILSWQRWEPAELDGWPVSEKTEATSLSATAETACAYPTAAQLEAIHQQAWKAGYEAGQVQGYQDGREQGAQQAYQEQTTQLTTAQEAFSALFTNMTTSLERFEDALAAEVLQLALHIGERLATQRIQSDPEAIASLLHHALEELPTTLSQAKIRLHPDDLEIAQSLLKHDMPKTTWQWLPDPELMRGECIFDTEAFQLDLRLCKRVAILRELLGIKDSA